MLAVSQILQNRYRIVRQLGHGGMGAVYEAIDERFGEPVALKEILIELTNSVNEKQKSLMLRAFEREAKSLAKARHEAVPHVRDYFSELERQFLVMELIEGDELADLLKNKKSPFPLDEALKWMDQLLDALDYLHTLKPPIVHRDIKPQNLKLTPRGRIKLLDFGIAKSADASSVTNHTFVGATLDYSPVEQILRVINPMFREFIVLKHKEKAENILNQSTDARCDIYSPGATFYHLLTNHLPTDVLERAVEVWSDEPDPLINPSKLNPKIPSLIADCILKAMKVERDDRFTSAQEMREALKTAIAKVSEDYKTKEVEENRNEEKENIFAQARLEYLRLEQEEKKRQEQLLMQAETDRLVSQKEIKRKTENKTSLDTNPLSTEPLQTPRSDTQSSASESPVTESSFTTVPNIQPLQNDSKPSLLDALSFDKVSAKENKEKKTTPALSTFGETKTKFNPYTKLFWILPLAALSILTFGGIGGFLWISNSNPTNSYKPAANIIVSTPTAEPTTKPTLEPCVSPSVKLTPSSTQSKPITENSKPKPTVVPKRTPIVVPTTRPAPKPKKTPNLTDDCFYNGKCK